MVGLAAFGTMNAVISGGARIALDRTVGWTRQLRLTPLSPRSYPVTKILVSYMTALITIASLAVAGTILGVRLSAVHWLGTVGLLLVGLLPFAALGILLGHLIGSDAIGPAVGGTTALLGFLGGTWFPIRTASCIPSRRRCRPTGSPRRATWRAAAAAGACSAGASPQRGRSRRSVLAAWAYRRDTQRA